MSIVTKKGGNTMQGFLQILNKGVRHRAAAMGFVLFMTSTVAQAGWFSSASSPDNVNPITAEQVKKVLEQNPQYVYDALVAYQKQQAEAKQLDIQKYLTTHARKLFYSKNDGVIGNPQGKTSLLILNDYRCGYCSKARLIIDDVIKNNDDVRVVIKQLPILGPESKYAAKAATLAQQKNKFDQFDAKLGALTKPITTEKVNTALKQTGLREQDLTANTDALDAVIRENYVHAQNLAVQGTPVLIIANSNLTKVEFIENVLDQKAIESRIKSFQS
jgi:protein-disulfide isomerase